MPHLLTAGQAPLPRRRPRLRRSARGSRPSPLRCSSPRACGSATCRSTATRSTGPSCVPKNRVASPSSAARRTARSKTFCRRPTAPHHRARIRRRRAVGRRRHRLFLQLRRSADLAAAARPRAHAPHPRSQVAIRRLCGRSPAQPAHQRLGRSHGPRPRGGQSPCRRRSGHRPRHAVGRGRRFLLVALPQPRRPSACLGLVESPQYALGRHRAARRPSQRRRHARAIAPSGRRTG